MRVSLTGIPIDVKSRNQILDQLTEWATHRNHPPRTAFGLYADCLLMAHNNVQYRSALQESDLNYPDGMGVVLALRFRGVRSQFLEKSTTTDLIHPLCERLAANRAAIFILGARPGVAEVAASKLREAHMGLEIVGTHHGYFSEQDSVSVVGQVNRSQAHVLIVCMGVPREQIWASTHRPDLEVPLIMTGGGLLDFVSGRVRRGPKWMTDHGLEWVFRLAIEPRRLSRRYVLGNFRFLVLLLRQLRRTGI